MFWFHQIYFHLFFIILLWDDLTPSPILLERGDKLVFHSVFSLSDLPHPLISLPKERDDRLVSHKVLSVGDVFLELHPLSLSSWRGAIA